MLYLWWNGEPRLLHHGFELFYRLFLCIWEESEQSFSELYNKKKVILTLVQGMAI